MRRPDWTYGFFYQRWSRFLHRFNLHQTREIGPLEDGATIIKCEWCGLSQSRRPHFPGDVIAEHTLEQEDQSETAIATYASEDRAVEALQEIAEYEGVAPINTMRSIALAALEPPPTESFETEAG